MRDVIYFWSILFQILGLKYNVKAVADFSWERNHPLTLTRIVILFVVLSTAVLDMIILLFNTVNQMSRGWTIWLNVSQICRIILVFYAILSVSRVVQDPTSGYYAAILTVICCSISAILRIIDYLKNGSSANKHRLSKEQRIILIVAFWNFLVMMIGALTFKFVEGWTYSDSWNFVNVSALTIGYGDLYPKTVAGKIILVTAGNICIVMAGYLVVCVKDLITPSKMKQKRNVIIFTVCIVVYVMFGAVVFLLLEDWNFLDSLFFVWYTLTTVGYGNIVPTRPISWEFWLIYVYTAISLYAFGLGLMTNRLSKLVNKHQNGFNHGDISLQNSQRSTDETSDVL